MRMEQLNGNPKVNRNLRINRSFSIKNDITLFLGDCLKFLRTVSDEEIQLVITSPPYNVGKEYEKRSDIEKYLDEQGSVIEECCRILKDSGSVCWEVGNYVQRGEVFPLDILLYDIFKKQGFQLRNRIIWYFGHGLHCKKRFSGRYETILWFTKSNEYTFNLDSVRIPQKYPGKKHFKGPNVGEYSGNPKGKNPTDVWDIPNVKNNHIEKTCHPCQFPIALAQRLILAFSDAGDIVLDPFMGVGTTAVAGVLNGRKVAGAEIVKKYYDISIERVIKAAKGDLAYRLDIPISQPNGSIKILENPFVDQSRLPIEEV
jgi:adenine-specific DNA-methyltransferase